MNVDINDDFRLWLTSMPSKVWQFFLLLFLYLISLGIPCTCVAERSQANERASKRAQSESNKVIQWCKQWSLWIVWKATPMEKGTFTSNGSMNLLIVHSCCLVYAFSMLLFRSAVSSEQLVGIFLMNGTHQIYKCLFEHYVCSWKNNLKCHGMRSNTWQYVNVGLNAVLFIAT